MNCSAIKCIVTILRSDTEETDRLFPVKSKKKKEIMHIDEESLDLQAMRTKLHDAAFRRCEAAWEQGKDREAA